MMRMIKALPALLLIAITVLYYSCSKENINKTGTASDVPAITFDTMAPNPAKKYMDTIKIVISYTDGNGDLGVNSSDVNNLFVTDSRDSVVSKFRIPQLAPDNANVIIQGKLDVILAPQGFTDDNHTTETAVYSIYVVDRAGNKSNTIQTPSLVINQ